MGLQVTVCLARLHINPEVADQQTVGHILFADTHFPPNESPIKIYIKIHILGLNKIRSCLYDSNQLELSCGCLQTAPTVPTQPPRPFLLSVWSSLGSCVYASV